MLSGETNDAGSDPAKAAPCALAISRKMQATLDASERGKLMALLNKLR
jgi:hypothetical protein